MTSKAALFALLAMWGVGSTACLPAFAEDTTTEAVVNSKTSKTGLTEVVLRGKLSCRAGGTHAVAAGARRQWP